MPQLIFGSVAKLHYSIRRSILDHSLSQIAGWDERHVSGHRHSIQAVRFMSALQRGLPLYFASHCAQSRTKVHGCGGSIRLSDRDEALLSDVRNTLDEIDFAPPSFISAHRRLAFNNHFDDLIGKLDVLRVTCDNERHGLLSAPSIDTRAHGVEINKIARKLGIGVSVVSRVVSGGSKMKNQIVAAFIVGRAN